LQTIEACAVVDAISSRMASLSKTFECSNAPAERMAEQREQREGAHEHQQVEPPVHRAVDDRAGADAEPAGRLCGSQMAVLTHRE